MTDHDLELLLRETFADKEKLVDTMPQAIKRRRPVAPVLLAAAAVLVVLGGILYGVDRGRDADTAPPVAVAPAGDDAEIWGAAITAITLKFQPQYRLDTVLVTDRTVAVAELQRASRVQPLSAAQKDRIAHVVAKDADVQLRWVTSESLSHENCLRTLASVTMGDVVDKGDHREISTRITYNCGSIYVLTYRVEKRGDLWSVTGTIGPGQAAMPAPGCPLKKQPPTTQRDGC